jgi:colanic acid biosynthesis glycosyl transferase WcaI
MGSFVADHPGWRLSLGIEQVLREIHDLTASNGRRSSPSRRRKAERMITGASRRLRVQLWSYNYDPEPTGIGPLSRAWATAMRDRGHEISVVTAHPHYPEPKWGTRLVPYREVRDGIPVLRLPIWPGRQSIGERLRQEATFVVALSGAAPFLGTPDLIVAVSPSFPALLPAMVNARLRQIPWVLWLQDLLPDAATVTGLLEEDKLVIRGARRLERAAYRSAARVVAISETFRDNLRARGVARDHVVRIFNPASRPVRTEPRDLGSVDGKLALNMGNIGRSQNLATVVRAFEGSSDLERAGARLVMAGDGVAGQEVRAMIGTDRVQVTGILTSEQLDRYIERAAIGVVTQSPRDHDFNVPSKLMNFMGAGVPVLASVDANSEVARILTESGGGWLTDSSQVEDQFAPAVLEALTNADERERRGATALEFARRNFDAAQIAERFEDVLLGTLRQSQ